MDRLRKEQEKTKQTLAKELERSRLLTEANQNLVQQAGESQHAYDELWLRLAKSEEAVTDNVRDLQKSLHHLTSYDHRRTRRGEREEARRNGNRSIMNWWQT